MNSCKYSESDLHLMSYQELRRLSLLLRLPANIKKKYMISMIQAHQKGDGSKKIAIANKIMEERKVKRTSTKGKQTKSFMLGSPNSTQQIPTDLSVSTKHEIETRFSYVAHYTSKDNTGSGISRIIKQEAEVSRRNRSILQPPRKPSKKLSPVGRTEIMLPRNHSLTTPVRLMPQYERGFPPPGQYETMPGLSNPENHFHDGNSYGYHFPGEYSNSLIPSTSPHELYRSDPYWHTRDVYNNSLMPILSSLLTPNPVTINSTNYSPQNALKSPTSFQGVYEKYVKNGNVMESQTFEAGVTSSSTVIVNNRFPADTNNNYNVTHGSYLVTKSDIDFEINTALDEISCQQYNRRDDTVIRRVNGNQTFLDDIYLPQRNGEPNVSSRVIQHITHEEDLSHFESGCFRSEMRNPPPVTENTIEASLITTHKTTQMIETEVEDVEPIPLLPPPTTNYSADQLEDGSRLWEESNNGGRIKGGDLKIEKDNYTNGLVTTHTSGSFLSVISEDSTDYSVETDNDPISCTESRETQFCAPSNFPRCRYTLGHNKYPEAASVANDMNTPVLPSFMSTFCSNWQYNKAYSVCRNSFTGTTETHLNPIMTSIYASQFASHSTPPQHNDANSAGSSPQIPRQWLYSYPESQVPFSVGSTTYTTWDKYSDDMSNKIIAHNNSHEVQVVKCRKHGCHYFYSIANPCD